MYPSSSTRGEIDLREEMDRSFEGASDELAKGKIGMFRRMRRDDHGNPVRCPCRDSQTDEPSRDYYCRYCLGMGFLWDEYEMLYYKNESSFSEGKGYLFYIRCDQEINREDYVMEIELDKEGLPALPIRYKMAYNIKKVHPFRLDENSRLEYWAVQAIKERQWSVHYGVKLRNCD